MATTNKLQQDYSWQSEVRIYRHEKLSRAPYNLSEVMGNRHCVRQLTMDKEPTTKRLKKDKELYPVSMDDPQQERIPLVTNRHDPPSAFHVPAPVEQEERPEGSAVPRVEYPRALHASPGYLQGTECGPHTLPCCPVGHPAWTYPYTWPPGSMPGTYGLDYQQNYYPTASNLPPMANMRRTHIEDVISSTTVVSTPGPMSAEAPPGPLPPRAAWDNSYTGPPPNVTIQPNDDSLLRNVILDVTLLSSAAQDIRSSNGPRMPLYSAQKIKIRPFRTRSVRTDIYWAFPDSTYGEIRASSRERFRHKGIEVISQKISNVPVDGLSVLLHNTTDRTYNLNIKDEIGEIILARILQPIIRSQFKAEQGSKDRLAKGPKASQPRNQQVDM